MTKWKPYEKKIKIDEAVMDQELKTILALNTSASN